MSIRFENVTKSFGNHVVLKNVSFEAASGEILFILGKSGMGKSVALKHIMGLIQPDSGKIFVGTHEIGDLLRRRDEAQLRKVRKMCGMVFQNPALIDSLSVFDNIAFGIKELPEKDDIKNRVYEKLALVNLSREILDRFPPELSYGMQKRVSLARTLAPGPSYLLFDEPTTGLDPINTTLVNEMIFELSRKLNVTSIVVSHDMGSALKIADRILVLDQTRVLAQGTVSEIKNSPAPLIHDFLVETLSESPRP